METPPQTLKVLVIRLSSIGDIILTTPVLDALKKAHPAAVVDYLVMDVYQEAIAGNQCVDRLILFDKQRYRGLSGILRFCRTHAVHDYDIIIDLHAKLRSVLMTLFIRGRVLRYCKRSWWKSLAVPLRLTRYHVNDTIVRNYFGPLQRLGIAYEGEKPTFNVSPDDRQAVQVYGGAVVMAPGAAFNTKKWPAEHFAALGRRLQGMIVLIGGGEDTALCDGIQREIGHRCVNLAGRLTLKQSGALMSLARYVVCNDSAAFHMARGVGTPAFVIFGPTDPGMFTYDDAAVLLRHPVACAPCSLHGDRCCPQGHFACMRDLTPEKVLAVIEGG